MIIRIVKLTFKPETVEDFLTIFAASKERIRSFPGCSHLELLRDLEKPEVFFTYSYWQAAEDLNNYRNSELFKSVWGPTKQLFGDRPQAWSVEQKEILA